MENENYLFGEQAAEYLRTTTRKISLFRRYKLLKSAKFGKSFVYKRSWLDQFAEQWQGYDLSNEKAVQLAISEKKWRSEND